MARVLRNGLGKGYTVIEDGLNGRTTVWDDPLNGGYKNGLKYLIPCLSSHRPIDICILLLGTNDLKKRFSLSALKIVSGIILLVKNVLTSQTGLGETAPELLIMAPHI